MAWSRNNRAHVHTNLALISLKQMKAKLWEKAGATPVKQLDFWPGATASPAMKKQKAKELAGMIEGVIVQWVEGVEYEAGYGGVKAINTIAAALSDGDKTVADVGEAVDASFFFSGEPEHA